VDTNRTKSLPASLGIGLTLVLLVSVVLPTQAQNPPRQVEPAQLQNQQPPESPAPVGRDNDRDNYGITRQELAAMDGFLDKHPETAEQLRKDPSLIDSKQFIDSHPELQAFLQAHPGIREEFTAHPDAFMRAEDRFDRRGDNRGITPEEIATMDRFLDSHPEIAEQLRKNPSLIDNKQFVGDHPELQAFLQAHPGIREEFDQHPYAFMRDEERYDRQGDQRGNNFGITRQEVAEMDGFLDKHPEIAEQLRKNPSLIDDKQFVDNHPELQTFLQEHPELRQEFREHPYAFMRDENRFDRGRGGDSDREVANFGNFLRGHSSTADALSKDPSLANNREFLASHPDLTNYLQEHPAVQQQLASNPQAVMTSPAVTENSSLGTQQHKPMTTSPSMGKPDTNMNPEPKQ
jgi:phage-related protein